MSKKRTVALAVGAAVAAGVVSVGVAVGAKHVFGSKETTRTQGLQHVDLVVVDGRAG